MIFVEKKFSLHWIAPALRRLRQEYFIRFGDSMGYLVNSRPSLVIV